MARHGPPQQTPPFTPPQQTPAISPPQTTEGYGTQIPPKSSLDGRTATEPVIWTPAARITERRFMAQITRYAELMGWRVYHTYDSRRSAAGFPDLVMVRRPRVVFAELKRERGTLTASQRDWLTELRACGQEAYLWRPSSWEAIERTLR